MRGFHGSYAAWGRACSASALMALLCACATLRVDVDVYKGPLTNDEDVQLQQIAMMVIGAKPMLEDMRDDLQDWNRWTPGKGGAEGFRREWRLRKVADPDSPIRGDAFQNGEAALRVVPGAFEDRKEFTNVYARQLNEILTLYLDVPEERIRETLNELDKQAQILSRVYGSGKGDEVSNRRLIPILRGISHLSSTIPTSRGFQGLDPYVKAELVEGLKRMEEKAVECLQQIQNAEQYTKGIAENEELVTSNTLSAATLEKREGVAAQETKLKNDEYEQARASLSRLKESATVRASTADKALREYEAKRKAAEDTKARVEKLKDYAIRLKEKATDVEQANVSEARKAARDAAEAHEAARIEGERMEAEARTAHADKEKAVAEAEESRKMVEEATRKLDGFRSAVENAMRVQDQLRQQGHSFRAEALQRKKDAAEAAAQLNATVESVRDIVAEIQVITRGPISSLTAFDQGRHPEGIATLVEAFAAAQKDKILADKSNRAEYCEKEIVLENQRELLLVSLLQFAEKVRRIADDSVFTSSGKMYLPDQILGATGFLSDAYVAHVDRPAFLQSLSNTVIAHINEYQHGQHVKKELERARAREQEARLKAMGPLELEVADSLDTGTIRSSADLMDQLITYLQYLQVKELQIHENWRQSNTEITTDTALLNVRVRASGTPGASSSETTTKTLRVVTKGTGFGERPYINPRSEEIQKALEKLLEYRATKVAIRPSLAALRSSSAASTLQGNPETVGWQNLLLRSAERGLPIIGERFANDGMNPLKWPEGQRRRLMAAEIDKQYWQNINNVRVSGAGRTNYVIVKDDVGNWYVKQYSSNPEKIIKAARNLALFNMSTPATGNLLGNLTDNAGLRAGLTPSQQKAAEKLPEGGAPQTKMQALLMSKREQFVAATKETLVSANARLMGQGGMKSRVESGWELNTEFWSASVTPDKDGIETVGAVLTSISSKAHTTAFEKLQGDAVPGIPAAGSRSEDDALLDQQSKRIEALMTAALDYSNLVAATIAARATLTDTQVQAVARAKGNLEGKDQAASGAKKKLDAARANQLTAERTYAERGDDYLAAADDEERKNAKNLRDEAEAERKTARDKTDEAEGDYEAELKDRQQAVDALAQAETALAQRRDALAKAVATLRAIVRAEVETILEKRQDSLDEYEAAVELLQEGVAL